MDRIHWAVVAAWADNCTVSHGVEDRDSNCWLMKCKKRASKLDKHNREVLLVLHTRKKCRMLYSLVRILRRRVTCGCSSSSGICRGSRRRPVVFIQTFHFGATTTTSRAALGLHLSLDLIHQVGLSPQKHGMVIAAIVGSLGNAFKAVKV